MRVVRPTVGVFSNSTSINSKYVGTITLELNVFGFYVLTFWDSVVMSYPIQILY